MLSNAGMICRALTSDSAEESAPRGSATRERLFQQIIVPAGFTLTHPRYNPAIGVVEGLAVLAEYDSYPFIKEVMPKTADQYFGPSTNYGPRLTGQLSAVEWQLLEDEHSRRAIAYIADGRDHPSGMPCTQSVQFLRRKGALWTVVNMRSQDVVKGLPHDIVMWGIVSLVFQQILRSPEAWLIFNSASLHVYNDDYVVVEEDQLQDGGTFAFEPNYFRNIRQAGDWAEAELLKAPWTEHPNTSWERRPRDLYFQAKELQ